MPEAAERALDEVVPHPQYRMTHCRTVSAPPAAVGMNCAGYHVGRSAESFDIARCRVGVPRWQGRAKIIPDGGAAGAGSLAPPPQTSRSLAAGSLAGAGGRC
jgi:hypothetical protein